MPRVMHPKPQGVRQQSSPQHPHHQRQTQLPAAPQLPLGNTVIVVHIALSSSRRTLPFCIALLSLNHASFQAWHIFAASRSFPRIAPLPSFPCIALFCSRIMPHRLRCSTPHIVPQCIMPPARQQTAATLPRSSTSSTTDIKTASHHSDSSPCLFSPFLLAHNYSSFPRCHSVLHLFLSHFTPKSLR